MGTSVSRFTGLVSPTCFPPSPPGAGGHRCLSVSILNIHTLTSPPSALYRSRMPHPFSSSEKMLILHPDHFKHICRCTLL